MSEAYTPSSSCFSVARLPRASFGGDSNTSSSWPERCFVQVVIVMPAVYTSLPMRLDEKARESLEAIDREGGLLRGSGPLRRGIRGSNNGATARRVVA